ncbi:endonuclease [Desulfonema ishimotonii]|uniref:Endonuclease n=1 Tax=Desulfonema ishimotonii TaxID=45657 RepID=A0A401FXJ6_9BACT|nr:endonuclease/exonuclease/phosphatase family protein [Desulfonema ishimotonii]GBC61708.1 endonuclease [Desulfonema ishimotonii]
MRFLLYNISYGAGVGRDLHFPFPYAGHLKRTGRNLNRIVSFIKSVEPDIVGLVEVDSGSFRSQKNNQAELIAEELDLCHVFESKYGENSVAHKVPVLNKQGNAVLMNQRISSRKFHYFSKGIKRLVIEVELKDLSLFLVHLSLKFRHRQYQLQELFQMIESADKPVIVAGDFNLFEGENEAALFLAATGLKSANRAGWASYPSTAPRKQLDYIFYSPEIRTRNFYIPPVRLSDHAPLIWDFDISDAPDHINSPSVRQRAA